MRSATTDKPLIDVNALADQLDLSPRETQIICQRLFWRMAEASGAAQEELQAAAHGTNVDPAMIRVIAEILGRDMRRPLPTQAETLGERVGEIAGEAREKIAELKDRVSKGVASIDVASVREESAEKVADLRDRAASVDVSEISDQARDLGGQAMKGARNLANRVRSKLKPNEVIEASPKIES